VTRGDVGRLKIFVAKGKKHGEQGRGKPRKMRLGIGCERPIVDIDVQKNGRSPSLKNRT